jgi:hypothetical protein
MRSFLGNMFFHDFNKCLFFCPVFLYRVVLWVTFQELITTFFHVIFYSSYCKYVKATGTHRRFEQGLSKLGTVGKTERLIMSSNVWVADIRTNGPSD